MSYDYSENILVQESAGNLLRDELGWDVRFAYNTEVLGKITGKGEPASGDCSSIFLVYNQPNKPLPLFRKCSVFFDGVNLFRT